MNEHYHSFIGPKICDYWEDENLPGEMCQYAECVVEETDTITTFQERWYEWNTLVWDDTLYLYTFTIDMPWQPLLLTPEAGLGLSEGPSPLLLPAGPSVLVQVQGCA